MPEVKKKKESSFSEIFDSGDITSAWVTALNSGKLTSEYAPDEEPDEVKRRLQKMKNNEAAESEELDLGVDGLGIHVTIGRKQGRGLAEELNASHEDKRMRKAEEGEITDVDDHEDLENLADFGDAEDIELMREAQGKALGGEPLVVTDAAPSLFGPISPPSSSLAKSESSYQEFTHLIPPLFALMLRQTLFGPRGFNDGLLPVASDCEYQSNILYSELTSY
jgi:hypothetical protein